MQFSDVLMNKRKSISSKKSESIQSSLKNDKEFKNHLKISAHYLSETFHALWFPQVKILNKDENGKKK